MHVEGKLHSQYWINNKQGFISLHCHNACYRSNKKGLIFHYNVLFRLLYIMLTPQRYDYNFIPCNVSMMVKWKSLKYRWPKVNQHLSCSCLFAHLFLVAHPWHSSSNNIILKVKDWLVNFMWSVNFPSKVRARIVGTCLALKPNFPMCFHHLIHFQAVAARVYM